jgi:hypothetical protein
MDTELEVFVNQMGLVFGKAPSVRKWAPVLFVAVLP